MDGNTIINRGRKRRLSWPTIYQPYVKLYNAIKAFIDPDYFGLLRWSEKDQVHIPMHVNSDKNPFPVTDYFGCKDRRRFGQRDMLCHAFAEPRDEWPHFAFMVNSPHRSYALICFDFDGEDYGQTCRLRARIYEDHFSGLPAFGEPSRNRNGCYQWLIIERDSSAAEFNRLCNDLTAELRRRYHDLGCVEEDEFHCRRHERVNFFDGIKATLHYEDRDETALLYAVADGNPNDNHRGLLATIPCSGFENDTGADEGGARMRRFLRFVEKKRGRYVNGIAEAHLRAVHASLRPAAVVEHVHVDLPLASASPSLHQLVPSELDGGERKTKKARTRTASGGQRDAARRRLLEKAKWHDNPQGRMRMASCLFFYEHQRYADTPDELVGYYESLGLHTAVDKGDRRIRRAREALDRHKANPAEVKSGIFFDPDEWVPLVRAYVTEGVRRHPALKYNYRIEDELLAAGLCLFTGSAMKVNRADRMHTCGQRSQFDWYRCLWDAGVLTARYKDKSKRVDVPKVLQLAGLIVLRDSEHKYGGRQHGVCDKYGLGINHPLYARFVALYGDVVDPKCLPCVVRFGDQQAA